MLMCEVEHQHYSCRTRITGFVADNMKGQEEIRKKIFSKKGREFGSWQYAPICLLILKFLKYI